MKIDKSKLKMGIWYEDENGNMYRNSDRGAGERPNDECTSYHTCFPLSISEEVSIYYDNKDTCKHSLKYRKRTGGWVKGVKGCKCTNCGKEKVGKSLIPFALMPWKPGCDTYHLITGNRSLSDLSGKCVVAMVNSGDYTLKEALVVMATSCERCMNVLIYKYLNGEDGYEEYSDEWKKANTVCDFCRGE